MSQIQFTILSLWSLSSFLMGIRGKNIYKMPAILCTNNKTWTNGEIIIKFGLMIMLLEDEQIGSFINHSKNIAAALTFKIENGHQC